MKSMQDASVTQGMDRNGFGLSPLTSEHTHKYPSGVQVPPLSHTQYSG